MDKYEKMKRPELAEVCRKHNLSDGGSATVLRKRIRDARDEALARKAAAQEVTEPDPEAPEDLPAAPDEESDEAPEDGGNDDETAHEVALTFGDDTYFADAAWEAANLKLIEQRATDAGHRLLGRAERVQVEGNTVTYRVRVE